MEKTHDEILQDEILNLITYLEKETNKGSKFKTLDEIKKLKSGKILAKRNPKELSKIYKKYEKKYRELYQDIDDSPNEKIIEDETDSFENKLEDYILFRSNYEGELSPKQFERLTRGWKKDRDKHSLDEWYEIYQHKLNSNPGNLIEYDPSEHQVKYYAFKSKKKIDKLAKSNIQLDISDRQDEPNQVFPVEDNKKFYLHKVAGPNTYFIDLMFEYEFCYLVAINANTRYLYVSLINSKVGKNGVAKNNLKKINSIIKALSNLLKQGMNPKVLIGDDEPSFHSEATKSFLGKDCKIEKVERIKKTVYPEFMSKKQTTKTEPLHSSLGIIDRVIRTLRDMAYTAQVDKITPEVMEDLVFQYNHAPHETLSKYSGMECTPEMAQNDKDLESHICRRILQQNYNIMTKPDFVIEDFEYVKVYNGKDPFQKRRSVIQPGLWFINGFEEGKYHVVNAENGDDQFLPRYRIHPE